MKLKIMLFVLSLTFFTSIQAQNFGLSATAGYADLGITYKEGGKKINLDGAKSGGFYFGLQAETKLSDKLNFQPELIFASNDNGDTLFLGTLLQYTLIENLNALFGPSFNYVLEEVDDDFGKFGIFASAGLGYTIIPNLWIQAKYNIQINNFYKGDNDISSRANPFIIGVGYKFL